MEDGRGPLAQEGKGAWSVGAAPRLGRTTSADEAGVLVPAPVT